MTHSRPLTNLVAVALVLAALVGCGGGSGDSADDLYSVYRSTEDERNLAEQLLRRSFSDIALAAEKRDSAGVRGAAERGRDAAEEIERLLAVEIDAARDLREFEGLAGDAGRLEQGLEQSRGALRLFIVQLDIAVEDPFLDETENVDEVSRLAREASRLSTEGELAIRRSDRALAEALGIKPRPDIQLDRERTTTAAR